MAMLVYVAVWPPQALLGVVYRVACGPAFGSVTHERRSEQLGRVERMSVEPWRGVAERAYVRPCRAHSQSKADGERQICVVAASVYSDILRAIWRIEHVPINRF
jgi:hypothetical protein